jgi:Probable cobalt transporter subunit (CbtB)
MERAIARWLDVVLPEPLSFMIKSAGLLLATGTILYVLLAASYPTVHDTLHKFRHALAVVPCH